MTMATVPASLARSFRKNSSKSGRVLLITNIFPPHIGGPATFIDKLGRELAQRGHCVTVVCSSDKPQEASDSARLFKVRRVCLAFREWYEIKIRLVLFWEMLWHRRILVNGLETYAAQVAGLLGKRYLLKIVGDSAWETARNRGTTLLSIDEFQADTQSQQAHRALIAQRNRGWKRASYIFTPSQYLREMVIRWGVPATRVITIPNGVTIENGPESLLAVRQRKEFSVLFVGRMTNWKGIETLLLALSRMPDVAASFVGDGPEYPYLYGLAKQLRLTQRTRFLGRLSADQVQHLIKKADALVLVSLYEGLSHTLLEACALGCPCIASDVGGNAEIITSGVDGLLVPPQDVAALCAAIRRLKEDSEFRLQISQRARSLASRFRFEDSVNAVATLLHREHNNEVEA